MPAPLSQTEATTLKRLPERGSYDREEAYAILDEALICHVGFAGADGRPVVIPTIHARRGDDLVIHGSPASRMLRSLKDDIDLCVTVTIIDGLVLAKSAFHHSINYRSVVVFGRATVITDRDAKFDALTAIVEHIVPGRSADAREPSESELKGTLVLSLALDEASVKRRTGGPIDDEDDLGLPVWAGVLPIHSEPGEAITDSTGVAPAMPAYVSSYGRPVAVQ